MKLSQFIKAGFGIAIGYGVGKLACNFVLGCTDKITVKFDKEKFQEFENLFKDKNN